ncbi:hypothetical protein [Clostridium saudiense]|uniref:hypothetical protein n=1 Tax=Clostridium saudiense TaxID=1414720 RepID=UPI0018AA5B49|nr:hypothetical protein [Clostridium saudiense]
MSRKLFEKRKKEICVGALGVVLLAGVGVSIGVMSNGVNDSNKTSVVDKVVDKDKADKEEAHDEKDKLVDSNLAENKDNDKSVMVTPEENASDSKANNSTTNESSSKDKGASSNSSTSKSESKPSNGSSSSSNSKPSSNSGSSSNSKPSTGGSSSNSKPSSNSGSSSNSKPSTGGSSSNSKPSSNSGSSSNSKPSTGGSSSNSKPSTGGSSNSGGTSKPESHTHNWVAITEQVHHDEEGHWEDYIVSPAWTEEVPIYEEQYRAICNTCGADITGSEASHVRNHMLNGENGSYRNEPTKVQVGTNKIEHPAVTDKKWIVDKAAWTETVTTGYKCSGCGATK